MQNVREGGRWAVKSVGGLVANLLLLTVWVDGVGIAPWLAVGINWVLVSIGGYALADQWVFQDADSPTSWRGHARQYLGMQGIMTASKAGNYVLYILLLPVVDYRIAWTIGAVVTFLVSFGLNRIWFTGDAVDERDGQVQRPREGCEGNSASEIGD